MQRKGGERFGVCIAGGGVLGCAVARALLQRQPHLSLCLLEKEADTGLHQSGRNSGVVHAGYNQKPGSLKARFVVEGSRRLRQFCREHSVALKEDGILVLARNESEAATLQTLYERGQANGAQVQLVEKADIAAFEPEAAGRAALWAKEGASFDARGYVRALRQEAVCQGAEVRVSAAVTGLEEQADGVVVRTARGNLLARVFVNAAGLHADRLAARLGVGQEYRIVPFRGYYSELIPERRALVRAHIYPCPDLNFPFLGVHLSRTFDDRVLVGPGAALALGREAYEISNLQASDVLEMLAFSGFWRLLTRPEFRGLLRQEWKKSLSPAAVAAEARQLVPAARPEDLMPSRAGIRAQLVARDGRLVEDLVVETTPRSVHILNAVSPALTCSLPFADHIAAQVLERL
jgi:L-2-hydroxyglutarate oxidase